MLFLAKYFPRFTLFFFPELLWMQASPKGIRVRTAGSVNERETRTEAKMIVFPKTPRRSLCDTAAVRTWQSRCGHWRVQCRRSLYGLPTVWLVLRLDTRNRVWDIVSRHRTKNATFRAARALGRKPGRCGRLMTQEERMPQWC